MSLATDEKQNDWDDDVQEVVPELREVTAAPVPAPTQVTTPVLEDPASADEGAGKVSAKEKAKLNRAAYRRGAAKALEIHSASPLARTVLAELAGTTEDTVELTASLLGAGRGLAQPLEDIDELATAIVENPLAAGVTAVAWGPARLKGVWGVLFAVGELDTSRIPAADVKAVMAILEPVGSLSDKIRDALHEANALSARN